MRVLFIDSTHKRLPEKLSNAGFEVDYYTNIKADEIPNIIENYDGVIIRSKIKLDKHIIDLAKKLKFIGRVGAGLENIDIDYAESKGIKCFNSPEGNRDAVGEQAIGMLLTLFNNILKADSEVRNGMWLREENRGLEIKGKTVGIIGYGNMGGAFAQRLRGFQANVIAYDKYKSNYSDEYVAENTLEELFEKSDILSMHVPLTEETNFMVNDEFINRFKKTIYILNTARGRVLKTDDLVKNLKTGKVLGAALDVLEYEQVSFENLHSSKKLPEAFQYLINSKNVVLTPHIAGWTQESNVKLSEFLADKIIKEFT
jgi:D-3-phosphoglycerate dehydrogenase